jgi:hypothetical protein
MGPELSSACSANLTCQIGPTGPANMTMNMTANMTAGPAGPQGLQGLNGTAATVDVNYTFIAPAGTNPAVTNVGSTSDALLDFILPEGIMNQTPNMTSVIVGSQWYDHNVASSDIAGYLTFNRSMPTDGEGTASASAPVVGTEYLIKSFVTLPNDPGLTALPAGGRVWSTYAKVDSTAGGDSYIVIRLYKRNLAGTEEEMYNLTTEALSTSVSVDVTTKTTPYDLPMNTTDRFVAKYFAKTVSAANPTITLYYDGTTHVSKASSPINQGIAGPQGPAGIAIWGGSDTQVMYNIGSNVTGNVNMTFDNATGTLHAYNFVGNFTESLDTSLSFYVKEGGNASLYRGQAVYVSGASGINPLVLPADNTQSDKTRVIGLIVNDTPKNGFTYVRRAGTLSNVDSRTTNLNINPYGQTWNAGDLLFSTTNGGLTNVRPTSGRSVKAAYSLRGSSINDTLMAYPMENPVWITDAQNENVTLRLGDNGGNTSVSIRNYSNYEKASINSLGNLNVNDTAGTLTNYAYLHGRSGGQVLTGGTQANDDLILNGTSSSTKTSSYVLIQPDKGNVGINISTKELSHPYPYTQLDVGGTISTRLGGDYLTEWQYRALTFGFYDPYYSWIQSGGSMPNTEQLRINPAGGNIYFSGSGSKVSIGVFNPTGQFQTTGVMRFQNLGAGTVTADAGGNLTSVSDEKYKTNIKPLDTKTSALTKVNALIPKSFQYTPESGLDSTNTYVGFVAQDVEKIIPEAVKTKSDVRYDTIKSKDKKTGEDIETTVEIPLGTTTKSLDDRAIIAVLVNALKEEDAKVNAQQKEIDDLTARLNKAGIK